MSIYEEQGSGLTQCCELDQTIGNATWMTLDFGQEISQLGWGNFFVTIPSLSFGSRRFPRNNIPEPSDQNHMIRRNAIDQ
jgi:hypothetical protein